MVYLHGCISIVFKIFGTITFDSYHYFLNQKTPYKEKKQATWKVLIIMCVIAAILLTLREHFNL